MPKNPPENMPRIISALFYDDPASALEWLSKAFGFKTRSSFPDADGNIMHAEMEVVDSVIMLGPASSNEKWRSPNSMQGCMNQCLCVYVDEVDAHCERARQAGATILSEPEDKFYGDRSYEAQDFEGHRWIFAQHIRDVSLEEMQSHV